MVQVHHGGQTRCDKEEKKMCIPGRVVVCGADFALFPVKEIRKRDIKLIKTEKVVMICGEDKPVYEKFNWDECPKINKMFEDLSPEEFRLEDYLIDNIIQRDLMGIGGIGL